jgi:HK97 gp10 family phage protein
MPGLKRVDGLQQLSRTLKQLPDVMRRGVVVSATRAGARVIAQEAQRNAPVGETGNLRRNISAFPIPKKYMPAGFDVGYQIRGDERGSAGDPNNAYYWRFIEMGRPNAAPKQKPNPIFRNALATQSRPAIAAFIDTFGKRVGRAVERAKR